MRTLGSRWWLLAVGALVIVVSLGAVACGSDSGDPSDAGVVTDQRPNDRVQAPAENGGKRAPGLQTPLADRRETLQDRREGARDRREAILDNLRAQMSAEDQALFDELQASIEEQRSALDKDRQELTDTLKELRDLTDKYLGLDADQSES